MQPAHYAVDQAKLIDQGTKIIYKYPTITKAFDIGRMVVNGRHPQGPTTYVIEKECSFVMYITTGNGMVTAGQETFVVKPQDVIMVPAGHRFAVEGELEYITFDCPAFYPEQSTVMT